MCSRKKGVQFGDLRIASWVTDRGDYNECPPESVLASVRSSDIRGEFGVEPQLTLK